MISRSKTLYETPECAEKEMPASLHIKPGMIALPYKVLHLKGNWGTVARFGGISMEGLADLLCGVCDVNKSVDLQAYGTNGNEQLTSEARVDIAGKVKECFTWESDVETCGWLAR